MSKTKADTADTVVTDEAVKAEPTIADLMALVQSQQEAMKALQAQVAAQAPVKAPEVDFSAEVKAAEKAGFAPQVVPSLQKGASPALRVDY